MSKGEGLGNQFLSNIREVDAIVHVVRCFEDSNVVHVDGSVNPLRDIETINLELIFSDLEILEPSRNIAFSSSSSSAISCSIWAQITNTPLPFSPANPRTSATPRLPAPSRQGLGQ
mgnify:CR=1 FL=1